MHYSEKHIPAEKVSEWIELVIQQYGDSVEKIVPLSTLQEVKESCRGLGGVYFFHRSDGTLIYIGQSEDSIATRVGKHASANVQESSFWQANQFALVQAVCLKNGAIAPQIEDQLVEKAKAFVVGGGP